MNDFSHDAGLWLTKALGASAGAAVSVIYLLPKSRHEAASRFFTGLGCGVMFGGPAGVWITRKLDLVNHLSSSDMVMMGSAAASLCAWWGLGILSRLASRYGQRTER